MRHRFIAIFILAILTYQGFSQISPNGRNQAMAVVKKFGQLCDLSKSQKEGLQQNKGSKPDSLSISEFRILFGSPFTQDGLTRKKDSLVILNFLDPKLQLFNCYSGQYIELSVKNIDSCLNMKSYLGRPYRVSVNQYIDTLLTYYNTTWSNIPDNMIFFEDKYYQRVGRNRAQVSVIATMERFEGNINPFFKDSLGIAEYNYAYKLDIPDSLAFKLRFYLSCDLIKGGKGETNFQIDSIGLVRPGRVMTITHRSKAHGYLEPYFQYGFGNIAFNSEDQRFDSININNSNYLNGGLNFSIYFGDRKNSRWDYGLTTGLGFKRAGSTVSLLSYTDTVVMNEGFTAEQIGEYDLYVAATNLEEKFDYNFLEIPLLLDARYYINKKRTYGFFGQLGGSFNYSLFNNYNFNSGQLEYKGHKKVEIPGQEDIHYYFDSDLPYYGFSTYDAIAYDENTVSISDFYISGKASLGFFGMNRARNIGWQIGGFIDMGMTNIYSSDFKPYSSISTEAGYVYNLSGVNQDFYLKNWGLELRFLIQIFKEQEKQVPIE